MSTEDKVLKTLFENKVIEVKPIIRGNAYLPEKEVGYFPYISSYGNNTILANFGGFTTATISSAATDENGYGTFEYAPPSGYYAICTKNLAEFG